MAEGDGHQDHLDGQCGRKPRRTAPSTGHGGPQERADHEGDQSHRESP